MHRRGDAGVGFELPKSIVSCHTYLQSTLSHADLASCFVRARRLNVIIQPHLRFVYELLKWDELQQIKRGQGIKRELEWATVAREIAAMNRPYARG